MRLPVPPAGAVHARFYREIVEALRELQSPQAPTPVWSCPASALPDAARFASCVLRVADLDVLAHSNGSAWIRADTGAVL